MLGKPPISSARQLLLDDSSAPSELRLVPGSDSRPASLAPELPVSLPQRSNLAELGCDSARSSPLLDEEKNLPYLFARLPAGLHEVIVVDGPSMDGTVTVARAMKPDVRILMETGNGKGNAVEEGFVACTDDIVVSLDAEGSTDPAEIPRVVAALCEGADFVKGSRFVQGGATADMTLSLAWAIAP